MTFSNQFINFQKDRFYLWGRKDKEQMKSSCWLLIIMRSVGRVQTLQVEKRTLIILGVGGFFFAGSLAFFAYEYFASFGDRSHLTSKVQQLTHRIGALEKNLEKAVMERASPKTGLPSLSINAMKFTRRAKREGFSVSFQLINQNAQDQHVSGTLVLVAQNDRPKNPVYKVIPEMALHKGVPLEPEKGKSFKVEKMKFIEAFFDGSSEEVFKTLNIFVYSQEGKLILEKSTSIPAS